MIEILFGLLFVVLAIPVLIFGIYGVIILYYGKLRKKKEFIEDVTENRLDPLVSVVIATHNEEKIISKKIENILASNYPLDKIEIVFVDDSNDSTPQIIEECSKKYSNIRLIRFHERMGYSPSMIAGVKAAQGEIIVLNDAGSFLDDQAIRNSVARLEDTQVGVVTGKDVILNMDESVAKSEGMYLRILGFLRTAETNLDSTFIIKGEATAVRKDLIKNLEICGETFDTTVGLFVRQQGYRVVYDPTVKFYEYAPSTNSDLIKQKTNRGANWIKVLWRFRHLMFKRKYGKYGSIILPMDFGMIAVAPIMIMIGFALLVVLTFFDPSFFAFTWVGIGFIFLLFLVFSRNLIITFVRFEYSLIKAFYQVVFTKRNHDRLDKVDSTRRC
jgi:cellulose synthase/poly-beta-1,6-N-acetylglucosamine synthase-like glycosyltransferase